MRPMFADTVVTETGVDLDQSSNDRRPQRPADYREWRRTRVLFMHSVSEAERAVVDEDVTEPASEPASGRASGVADLPAQRRRTDL